MMKLAQVNSTSTGTYSTWNNRAWFGNVTDCETKFSTTYFPNDSVNLIAICKNIIENIGEAGYSGFADTQKIIVYSENYLDVNRPKLSIMVALPFSKKFYCIGSNGGTSRNTSLTGALCPDTGTSHTCSGCVRDPNGGGS